MNFPLNRVFIALILGLSISYSNAASETQASNLDVDPLACTDEEIQMVMDKYKQSLGKPSDYQVPNFEKFRKVRMAHRSKDPDKKEKNLCDVINETTFEIPTIDWTKVEAGWAALKALMAGNEQGVPWSTVISEAYAQGLAQAKEWWAKSSCKFAQNFSAAVNENIDDAYEESKKLAKKRITDTEEAKALGIKDLDKPLWQQVAKKKTDEQLGDYASYAKWYDEDQWGGDNSQDAMDALINKALGDQTEKLLDKNLKDQGSKKMGSLLDKVEPKY